MNPDHETGKTAETVATAEEFDVIVVGGGPAGSTAATAVALRGHRVLLFQEGTILQERGVFGGPLEKETPLHPGGLMVSEDGLTWVAE